MRKWGLIPVLALCAHSTLWCAVAMGEPYTVPLLVRAGTPGAPQGVLRILNGTDESGTVEIYAVDDAGARTGPATFTLNASAAVEFTATDLQSGNASLGLTGGIGTAVGDARILIDTDLEIVPLAFVRAADGTLSAMHDTVPVAYVEDAGRYRYEVPVFSPSTETVQASRLRLINPGDSAATVTTDARDDTGAAASGGAVTLTLPGGESRTLTAHQLEGGDSSIAGRLGAGSGRWRLTVSSDQPLQVVNIAVSAAGSWNNLSTTAVAGAAPADRVGFDARFLGEHVVFETNTGRFTLETMEGERFTETGGSGGSAVTRTGGYDYAEIGPEAGRLTLASDNGEECRTHLYFTSGTGGWFASNCTGGAQPAGGTWSGGRWFVQEDNGGGGVVETGYGVNDVLSGVPASGTFVPAHLSGGTVSETAGGGTTVALQDGGYFELDDGTRYTCTASGGCTIVNGTVTAGTVTGREAGPGEVDRFPSFRTAAAPGNRTYTVGTVIGALTLPEATGGNGTLTYSLSPEVPGLSFDDTTRRLSGTPSAAGTHAMTYTVTDEDGDTDTLGFTITVSAGSATEGSRGVCRVGMTLMSGQSCAYPDTTDEFSVSARGRGRFLTFLAGIRIRIDNQTINGRVYDFLASHQGNGVWRIDRIAGATEPPGGGVPGTGGGGADTSPSFAPGSGPGDRTYTVGTVIDILMLPEAGGGNGTLTYSLSPEVPGLSFNATARQLSGAPTTAGTYAMTYTASDEDGDTDTLRFAIAVVKAKFVQDFGDVRTVEVTPPGFVHVSVVDLEDFEPGTHGQRITDVFLDNTSCASLDQLWGEREFLIDGVLVSGTNPSGVVRHTLKDDSGIFFTATDDSPLYATGRDNSNFFELQGRPFHVEARVGAEWIRDHDTLVISSLENFTGKSTGNGFEAEPVYCEDFDPENFIPLCGALDDYIAHSGVGMEKTVFVGGIDRFGTAQAAIRADGVFAPNTIYVESPDGSTSQATAVLASYAATLAHANPTWSASELRTELMRIARRVTVNHAAGKNAFGTEVTKRRTVNVIRPFMAPECPL
ncbi:MAG: putative Ig domain-containing protein [Rhodospirillaceae bacterium]|nr:putative Ig domain-containing protein [Rhodospirillaceae bacterium]MDE0363229.1 putative Ig domain-containing protein [Rhodospirillaceae bacterium]